MSKDIILKKIDSLPAVFFSYSVIGLVVGTLAGFHFFSFRASCTVFPPCIVSQTLVKVIAVNTLVPSC